MKLERPGDEFRVEVGPVNGATAWRLKVSTSARPLRSLETLASALVVAACVVTGIGVFRRLLRIRRKRVKRRVADGQGTIPGRCASNMSEGP